MAATSGVHPDGQPTDGHPNHRSPPPPPRSPLANHDQAPAGSLKCARMTNSNHLITNKLCRSNVVGALLALLICTNCWLKSAATASVEHGLNIAAISPAAAAEASALQAIADTGEQRAGDVYAIKEGADLDLSCPIVVQNEDMIISWTCNNEPANIRTSRIHVTESGKLRILTAKVGDSCNYRCEAADGFGTLSVIIKVIIVDQRLMDQLNRRAGITAQSSNSSMLNQVDHSGTNTELKPPRYSHQQANNHQKQTGLGPPRSPIDNGLDIEMHIEPSEVSVSKNKTFSLECRIKHAPNGVPPQIIWLKEYIGAHIDSVNEAIDKNLIVIDGVYFHSLNWPRANSYSEMSSTTSSALLVKQANYVHSGRYACFAGYRASMMNLHFNSTSPTANGLASASKQPIRYKIAQALVKVDDEEGYKSSISYLANGELTRNSHSTANIFVSVIASNTWIRNLTFVLLVFCISLTMFKFFRTTKKVIPKKSLRVDSGTTTTGAAAATAAAIANGEVVTNAQRHLETSQPAAFISNDYMTEFLPDHLNASNVPANSLMNDSNPLGERYQIDQALLSERLNCIDSTTTSYSNNDHVYSEIGYQNHHEQL